MYALVAASSTIMPRSCWSLTTRFSANGSRRRPATIVVRDQSALRLPQPIISMIVGTHSASTHALAHWARRQYSPAHRRQQFISGFRLAGFQVAASLHSPTCGVQCFGLPLEAIDFIGDYLRLGASIPLLANFFIVGTMREVASGVTARRSPHDTAMFAVGEVVRGNVAASRDSATRCKARSFPEAEVCDQRQCHV
ncbi:MAG: hypothetical protein U5R48_02880 [Gammaproteobacteria bacterium]|nr:hypothetical protein [Gammaproteobacteria bacterium]